MCIRWENEWELEWELSMSDLVNDRRALVPHKEINITGIQNNDSLNCTMCTLAWNLA